MILKTLQRSGNPLASPAEQLRILEDHGRIGGVSFVEKLTEQQQWPLLRKGLKTLQINVGRVCNQTCTHCHVDAGPDRREIMNEETARQVIAFMSNAKIETLDITGGAPEMNPNFRMLVEEAVGLGVQVIDRCNLTILLAPGFTDLPEFLTQSRVNIIASLPCYLEQNCDAQRGDGVFVRSIEAIRRLNSLGYGEPDSGLELNLVYNPTGLGLPPNQSSLEADYRRELMARYGIRFNRLYTITNMPISRFLDDLLRRKQYEVYMDKLVQHFNPQTLDGLMCRSLVSVDWQGYLYDCDFNQMLDLPIKIGAGRLHITEVTADQLTEHRIWVSNHCFGCTAGCGSSCGGSLLEST